MGVFSFLNWFIQASTNEFGSLIFISSKKLNLEAIAIKDLTFDFLIKNMSVEEAFAFIVSATYDLQKKGVVKDNARSIGKKEWRKSTK